MSPINITLISWHTLWVYWPMYLALLKTEDNSGNTIKFKIEVPTGDTTDLSIKKHWFRKLRQLHKDRQIDIILALSEPTSLQEENEQIPEGFTIRKIPLLWRQPHWLLMNRQSDFVKRKLRTEARYDNSTVNAIDVPLNDLPENLRIYCLPSGTTSGDFVRTLCLKSTALIDEKEFTFIEDVEFGSGFISDDTEGSCSITYTPQHLTDKPRVVALQEFVGPQQSISSLLVPYQEEVNDNPIYSKIYDEILVNLQQTLSTLNNTEGDWKQIRQYISGYHSRIKNLFPKPPSQEIYDKPDDIAKCLSAYILRGCYFPFKVAGDTLLGEVSLLVRRELEDIKRNVQKNVHRKMSHLLGSGKSWAQLSFAERVFAIKNWSGGGNKTNQIDLLTYLSHIHLNPHNLKFGYQTIIKAIEVKTNENRSDTLLVGFNGRDCRLFCGTPSLGSNGLPEQPIFGDCTKQTFHFTSNDLSKLNSVCFTCQLCGIPGSILKAGSKLIGEKLQIKYRETNPRDELSANLIDGYALNASNSDSDENFFTLLCWEDLQEMFTIFTEEMRVPDTGNPQPPCAIVISNDWKPNTRGYTLCTIFWRGETKKGSGLGGNTRKKLHLWAQTKKGSKPESVGLWFRNPDESFQWLPIFRYNFDEQQGKIKEIIPPDMLYVEQLNVWKQAQKIAEKGDYKFAYVALFNYPGFQEEAL